MTVSEVMDYTEDNIFFHEPVYMADVSELLDAIATAPLECQRLMIVGHNPGMEDLLFYLTEEVDVPDDGKVMPTATIAVLETESSGAPWNTHPVDFRSLPGVVISEYYTLIKYRLYKPQSYS